MPLSLICADSERVREMSRRDDENLIAMLIQSIRYAWWHRPGYEAIGQVLETFDALGFETRSGLRPVLSHKHRSPNGWHLVFVLPPGISSQDVIAKLHHFEEQVCGSITAKANGNKLHLDISTAQLPQKVEFDWQPDQYSDMHLPIPIGHTITGPLIIDLAKLPHMLIAGNTGGGKTTFLRTATTALLYRLDVFIVVIDLKGLDFGYLRNCDRALLVDTEQDASDVLAALNKELDRRRRILQAAGATKLPEYPGDDLPWLVCVIDELAELREKENQEALNRLGRLARAVGISLMVATQRPSHTLFNKFTDLRMLFAGRLVFSVPKPEDSRLILDTDTASKLPADVPGRAVWRWDNEYIVQCPNLSVRAAKRLLAQIPAHEGVRWYEPSASRLLPR